MSLNLAKDKARMTVWGRGWNDEVTDSGEGETEEGSALEDFVIDLEYDPETDPDFNPDNIPSYDPDTGVGYDLTYDFGDNFNWDALAEDIDINLDIDGNINSDQIESLTQAIADLAINEEAIYNYMTDHGDSTGIPARIRVTNLPDKLEYNDGDEIDFSGIVVCAYSSLTTRTPFIRQEWEGPRHNQVPFDELAFPIRAATGTGGKISDLDTSRVIDQPISIGSYFALEFDSHGKYVPWHKVEYYGDHLIATTVPLLHQLYSASILIASEDKGHGGTKIFYDYSTGSSTSSTIELTKSFTHNGKTVYWARDSITSSGLVYTLNGNYRIPFRGFLDYYGNEVAWTMVYGDNALSDNTIPVQWQTEYREEPYEASFEIQVT